jgi:hypothetical protein
MNANTPTRRTLAAMLLTTATACAGFGLAGAAPAAADDTFIFIAAGDLNDAPPVQVAGGLAIGSDQNRVAQDAISKCVANGGHQCTVITGGPGECAAVVANDIGEIKGAHNPSLRVAQEHASTATTSRQGLHVVASGCATGFVTTPAPPAPKPAPTVTFNPVLGGLAAQVTDHSGTSSQCTVAVGGDPRANRTFALGANATADVRIVPLLPRFRNQDVTITCDNGTRAQASTFF